MIPTIRLGSDVLIRAYFIDSGRKQKWEDFPVIRICAISEKGLDESCIWSIDPEDPTTLRVNFPHNRQYYTESISLYFEMTNKESSIISFRVLDCFTLCNYAYEVKEVINEEPRGISSGVYIKAVEMAHYRR